MNFSWSSYYVCEKISHAHKQPWQQSIGSNQLKSHIPRCAYARWQSPASKSTHMFQLHAHPSLTRNNHVRAHTHTYALEYKHNRLLILISTVTEQLTRAHKCMRTHTGVRAKDRPQKLASLFYQLRKMLVGLRHKRAVTSSASNPTAATIRT